jgi:nucleoid-associated protein YgaU
MKIKNGHLILIFSLIVSCAEKPQRIKSPLFENPTPPPSSLKEVKIIPQSFPFAVQAERKAAAIVEEQARFVIAKETLKTIEKNDQIGEQSFLIKESNELDQEKQSKSEGPLVYLTAEGDEVDKIARAYLGSRKKFKRLLKYNPGLRAGRLPAGTKIQIPRAELNPRSIYLTKHIINQHRDTLAQIFGAKKTTLTHRTRKKETLQKISKDKYGTTRRWTEIYLINLKQIKNPDRLEIGRNLRLIK